MLRFWFHRDGLFPRFLEGIGLLGSGLILSHEGPLAQGLRPDAATCLFLLLLGGSLFIWACDWIRWYAPQDRDLGIAVHFRKARIPTSYILVITVLGTLAGLRYLIVIPALLCLSTVVAVNGILIHFHHRDKDPLPINYFSSNKYLKSPLTPL